MDIREYGGSPSISVVRKEPMSIAKLTRTVAVAISVAVLTLAFALPVAAHGGHGACQGFGLFFAEWAQGGYTVAGLDNPGLGPLATSPGVIAEAVEHEHELFCAPAE
jgi:hypothetical protein